MSDNTPIYTFFLGTNSVLSASELLAVLKRSSIPYKIISIHKRYLRAALQKPLPPDFIKSLGGTLRISLDVSSWNSMPSGEEMLDALGTLPDKWQIGIGSLGLSQNMGKVGVELKKAARARNAKLSFIEPRRGSKDTLLNAGQVLFYKLIQEPNAELIFLQDNGTIFLIKTISIQDIASYELRDTSRPARDAKVGMLPPKLAQIMINLAMPSDTDSAPTLYDPFCGMGTILQEAYLMGIKSFGTDISERMVRASMENLEHIAQNFPVEKTLMPLVFAHDATSPNIPKEVPLTPGTVLVTEPFLGAPQSRALSPAEASNFYDSVMPLYQRFFMNMKSVLPESSKILILFPAPKVSENGRSAFTPLPREFLDELASFGYRKIQLVPQEIARLQSGNADAPLLYARPDAFIAREITYWERV